MFSTFARSGKVFTCLLNSQSWLTANVQKFGAALLAIRQLQQAPAFASPTCSHARERQLSAGSSVAGILIERHSYNISAFPTCSNTTGWVKKHANNILITGHREYMLV